MPTSLPSKLLQGTLVSILGSTGAFFVWTKHCHFTDLDPASDPTFQSPFYRKFNAVPNPTTHDVCVRRIPIVKLKPALAKDAAEGGSKLVEGFCAGVWGGFGYTIQREYLKNKYQSPKTSHQLWTRPALLHSAYPPGTEITDHFIVLSKTPSSILIRCGDSPLHNPDSPRPSDGLFEIGTDFKLDEGYVEFRLKSVFYQGEGVSGTGRPPMEGWMLVAHRWYTKLWMESAVRNVMRY